MFGVSLFRTLTARPPTPPRDTQSDEIEQSLDQAISFLDGDPSVESTLLAPIPRRLIHQFDTPERTPSASKEDISTSRLGDGSTAKKVNFAPFVHWEFHNSPVHPPTVTVVPVKPLAPSRERISNKSILKPFKMITSQPITKQPYSSLLMMLEETVDALRRGDIAVRVSAYGSCLHTLQNFDSFPDTQSLADHSNALLQYIRRDMETEATSDPNHSKLAISAIKLLIALIRIPESSSWFDSDRLADIMEFSVSLVQATTAPKSIVNHHLFFLSQQKFSSKIMTADRVSRTISALVCIHDKISGTGVRAHRLLIYRRFVDQCPTVMRARAVDWIVNLYTSMLSQKKEVREQAIDLGFTTALRFGGNAEMSRFVQELLDKEFDKKTFGQFAIERLQDLLKVKEVCVPQIWSITVLFLRGRNKKDNHWAWFRPWLELASSCVNSSDKGIKIETILAWRKLIFACMPDMQTSKAVRNLLKAPIEAHMKKERDFTKGVGHCTMLTYFCLLHYSLRAGISSEQLDSYWDEYVSSVLNTFVSRSGENVYYACSILQTLFRLRPGVKAVKIGDDPQFDFEEPPALEPRWLRSRLDRVLTLLSKFLLLPACWDPIDDERLDNDKRDLEHCDSLGLITWLILMDTIREAGRMEVTTSLELKGAIASIVNSLHQLVQAFRAFDKRGFQAIKAYTSLVKGTMERLGPSHFAERMLLRNSANGFEVAPTPSQRSKSGGSIVSPMTHLFLLQLSLTSDKMPIVGQAESIRTITVQCWNSLKSRNARLDLLGDLSEALESYRGDVHMPSELLQEIADLLLELAEETVLVNSSHLVAQPSMTSSDITSLLRIFRHLLPFLTANRIPKVLYAHIVKGARAISGDGGVLLLVTEPQSAIIANLMTQNVPGQSEMLLNYASLIINNDTRPRLGSMERARKQIWGGLSSGSDKFQDADLVHTNIWNLFETALRYGYTHLDETLTISVAFSEFLEAMQQHIGRSLRSFHTLVRFTQNAFATILLDEGRRLKDVSRTAAGSKLLASVLALWIEITERYRNDFKTTNPACNWLETVQDLILAGFNSPRQSIVNVTITFWNDFIDQATDLLLDIDYPEKLINAALCLRSVGDVHLPSGYADKENEPIPDARTFVAFSDYGSQPSTTPLAVRAFGPPNHGRKMSPLPPKVDILRMKSPASKSTPRRKLRHEDSQIVFEPITSSPVRAIEETQNFTDHQKEVMERQKDQAAAMFRDIGSDDISSHSSNKLIINSDVAVVSSDSVDDSSRPTTPNLDLHDLADDDDRSSPIAASQGRRQNRSSSSNPRSPAVQELPSSPPSASKEKSTVVVLMQGDEEIPTFALSNHDVEMADASDEAPMAIPETIPDSLQAIEALTYDSIPVSPESKVQASPNKPQTPPSRIASDDDPSSQLVSEMMASQSSPMKDDLQEADMDTVETSQVTMPEDSNETQSTASIRRGHKTASDIYPDVSSQSFEEEEDEEPVVYVYGTRSRSRASAKSQSQETESVPLKRKRGRPRKTDSSGPRILEDAADKQRSARSILRPSQLDIEETSQRGRASRRAARYTMDTEVEGRTARSSSRSSIRVSKTPSSKRRKSDNGEVLSVSDQELANLLSDDDEEEDEVQEDISVKETITPRSIMARLRALLADAKAVTWCHADRLEVTDLTFELQAAARGYVQQ